MLQLFLVNFNIVSNLNNTLKRSHTGCDVQNHLNKKIDCRPSLQLNHSGKNLSGLYATYELPAEFKLSPKCEFG